MADDKGKLLSYISHLLRFPSLNQVWKQQKINGEVTSF